MKTHFRTNQQQMSPYSSENRSKKSAKTPILATLSPILVKSIQLQIRIHHICWTLQCYHHCISLQSWTEKWSFYYKLDFLAKLNIFLNLLVSICQKLCDPPPPPKNKKCLFSRNLYP